MKLKEMASESATASLTITVASTVAAGSSILYPFMQNAKCIKSKVFKRIFTEFKWKQYPLTKHRSMVIGEGAGSDSLFFV